ncbi:thioredoxin family protein [Sphingobacterium yanglingense]|uniref:Thioredoxin n=1 Tax=Sphingobacterium yanglingense TaxID=1437280 RepID=A0A4R6WHN1_9SPHI|nr:thioredoxin family protein [Sphingobacterium yanglingense]TDQ77907.1 thioredoxin [Sphingobacterium yanglingense]
MKKMKSLRWGVCSLLFVMGTMAVQAQDRSIKFEEGTWAEIKAKAVKENKAIFMDCYTSWCGPCKQLARDVFTNNDVADFYNANFINAKFDMEKGEGPGLAKEYAVRAYPTLLFIAADGKLISNREGALDVTAFLKLGKNSVSGESIESLLSTYESGQRDAAFMVKFMNRMEGQKQNISAIIEDYFSKVPQAEWSSKDNWYLINRYVRRADSPVFAYVLGHRAAYEKMYSAEAVSDYYVMVYRSLIEKAANSPFPVEDLADQRDEFLKMDFRGAGLLALECDAASADRSKDLKSYVNVMEKIFQEYPNPDKEKHYETVHYTCWKILQRSGNKEVLQQTARMASIAMETKQPAFMDTYACVLADLGELDKAIAIEETILAMLKIKPDPDLSIAACQQRIEKFQRLKELNKN